MNENVGMVKKSIPNIVPLCDILLILMIIFMVIAPAFSRGIDIYLPEITHGGILRDDIVVMDKNTSITFNQKTVTIEKLTGIISDYYRSRANKIVFVFADKHLAYKHVVKLIEMIKAAGIDQIILPPTIYDSSKN